MESKIVDDYYKLQKIGTNKGYKYYASPFKSHSVNHSKKVITTWCQINNEENILLSHELGHVYLWKIERLFRIINEAIAWMIGYVICKINKVNTKDFYNIMKRCLNTYIKLK